MREIRVGENIRLGKANPLVLIAGPCVIESEKLTLRTAEKVKSISDRLEIPFIFKSSYRKDNRSSARSYQGPGLVKGLTILARVKRELGVPILSDVHYLEEVQPAAEVLDILQIPAFLSMQTELTLAVARSGRVVNVKKGQFLAPGDVRHIVRKIKEAGNSRILLTERGTCFGYHDLVVDFRSLPILRSLGYPVIFDVTHTVRVYGRPSSDPAGGQPEYIPCLARAGVAAGCDAIFIETHPEPSHALCDAASMLPLKSLPDLLRQLQEIDSTVRAGASGGGRQGSRQRGKDRNRLPRTSFVL